MPEQVHKSDLYRHHVYRRRKGQKLYFCKKCVRSYDSPADRCKFCGSRMQMLDEALKMHYYYCESCETTKETMKIMKKCERCGNPLLEIKRHSTLKADEKVEIGARKLFRQLKRRRKK